MSDGNQLAVTPTAGAVVRDAGVELEVRAEINAAAMGAREEAAVKARVMLARANPRDWDLVRTRVLKDCRRPGFAKTAVYSVPRAGKVIQGLSIRFAEDIARTMGNLWVSSMIISETRDQRTVDVFAMDLETNFTESQQAIMSRTVERRANRDGTPPVAPDAVLGERRNSYGDKVFICIATDEEMLTKQNALVSRIRRNKILEMVPADILEEAKQTAMQVAADADAKDPDAAKKAVLDGFASISVSADALKSFIQTKYGTTLDLLRPEVLAELRGIFHAVRDNMATWESFVGAVAPGQTVAPKTGEVVTAPPVVPRAATPELVAQTRIEPVLIPTPAASQTVTVDHQVDDHLRQQPANVVQFRQKEESEVRELKGIPVSTIGGKTGEPAPVAPAPTTVKVLTFEELIAEIRAARVDPKDKKARLQKASKAIASFSGTVEQKTKLTRVYLAAVSGAVDPGDS